MLSDNNTLNIQEAVFPLPSLAVNVIAVVPVITVPAAGDCVTVGVPPQLSDKAVVLVV